jgi:hypothetical protein
LAGLAGSAGFAGSAGLGGSAGFAGSAGLAAPLFLRFDLELMPVREKAKMIPIRTITSFFMIPFHLLP